MPVWPVQSCTSSLDARVLNPIDTQDACTLNTQLLPIELPPFLAHPTLCKFQLHTFGGLMPSLMNLSLCLMGSTMASTNS